VAAPDQSSNFARTMRSGAFLCFYVATGISGAPSHFSTAALGNLRIRRQPRLHIAAGVVDR